MKRYFLLFLFILHCSVYAIDNPHFYRANFFWGEPRFEKPWLTSFDIYLGGGNTHHARNSSGGNTSLLNIFGPQNMRVLAENVPGLDPSNPLDAILLNLEQVPAREDFGMVQYFGKFSIIEGVINAYQNLCSGFFLQAYLPIRRLKINHISFADLSPTDATMPNNTTPQWVAFLNNFSAIQQQFSLNTNTIKHIGIGDFSFLGGWACNYEDTCYIDYFDVDSKIGILFPTAPKRNEANPFDIPLGYNGHYGVPLKFDCSVGYWEWLTVGFHIGALFLIEKKQTIRMKTAADQNGFFFLAQGQANVDPGTIWEVSSYIKADHFAKGLSLLVGYCFTKKDRDWITPQNNSTFNYTIVNQDQRFLGWDMHVLHFMGEYDFTKYSTDIGPRIGIFYNYIFAGKRIFNTSIVAPYLGFDFSWEY